MKRIFAIVLALVMTACVMLPVSAEDEMLLTATADETPGSSNTYTYFDCDDYGDNFNTELQKGVLGTNTAFPLKPTVTDADIDKCWIDYYLTAPADCTRIDIVVLYAAKGEGRYMDVSLDDDLRHTLCPDTADWGTYLELTITYENVAAGDHTLRFATPADFDNETIKTPNIESFTVNMYFVDGAEVPDTEAPETQAPETKAPDTEAPETQTPDTQASAANTKASAEDVKDGKSGCGSAMGAAAVIIAMTSVLGCAIVKKH